MRCYSRLCYFIYAVNTLLLFILQVWFVLDAYTHVMDTAAYDTTPLIRILDDKIFSAPKSRAPNSNAFAYAERVLPIKGRSTWALITLFVVDGISQIFLCSTPKRSLSSTPFRFCRYRHRFQRYLRSNSKVVVNRTDFCTFLLSQISTGVVPPKVVLALTPQPRDTSSAKVSSGYAP